MKKLEVFFDYNCPFCLKGHDSLVEFVADKPDLEIIWHPCEISEYKNNMSGTQTDISIQAMLFAAENNIDLWPFHRKIYNMIFNDRLNTKDIDTFVNALGDLADTEALRKALESGKYIDKVKAANKFAFKETGVNVVPTYRADGGVLQDRQEFYGLGYSNTAYGGRK